MRKKSHRMTTAAGLALCGGYLLAGPGTGCINFAAETALQTADFCFIFDCQNGLLGGTVDPCVGTAPGDQSNQQPLFIDCPGFVAP